MALRDQVGMLIRSRRLALGLTLREAAPRCRLSFAMLGQIEIGKVNTTIDRLEEIARGLGSDLAITDRSTAPTDPRSAVAARFLAVLPHLPEDDLDVFVHEIALWERRYLTK